MTLPGGPPSDPQLAEDRLASTTAAEATAPEPTSGGAFGAIATRIGRWGRHTVRRAARRPLVHAGGIAAMLLVGFAAGRLGRWQAPEAAPPEREVLQPLVACMRGGGGDRAGRVVFGKLGGKLLSEALRDHELPPDDVYRARQAFERVPGFHAPSDGRFVAALGASGALEALDLVISPAEMYVASSDGAGSLVGQRARSAPEQRPCFGSMRVGVGFAESVRGTPFHHEISSALDAALGATAAAAAVAPGTNLRIVARELRALGAFAGYDGLEAVEVSAPSDATHGRRTYRFMTERGVAYFDAEGRDLSGRSAALADSQRAAFRRHVALLDVELDRIAQPPAEQAATEVPDEPEPLPPSEAPVHADARQTVRHAAEESCSTRVVDGLSRQIIAEARCLMTDAFVRVPARPNLKTNANVFPYLERAARDQLVAALDANPGKEMTVNSALRTIPQQVILSLWGETRRCGVRLAASPGESNHESGLALDIQEARSWRTSLERRGFHWMGAKDPVHFDYDGLHAVDRRGLDVRAFQRLWNRNHPTDALPETGHFEPKTAARVAMSPAAGFPIGARCESPKAR